MPVRKYRSVEEMPPVAPLASQGLEGIRIACELSELAYALHPWKLEPGVRKFRSVEEMDRHRQEQEKIRVRKGRSS